MDIQQLHDKAMEFTDLAIVSKQKGEIQKANSFFGQAFKFEEKAANMAIERNIGQPTIGILLRSSATLASDKGDIDKLLQLTRKALILNIPEEFKTDFKQLLDSNYLKINELSIGDIDMLITRRALKKFQGKGVTRANSANQIYA